MERCGTCRHWQSFDDYEPGFDSKDYPKGFGTCNAIGFLPDYDIPLEKRSSWLAGTEDGSGYFACLRTKEAFGCVLHEPKEQAT